MKPSVLSAAILAATSMPLMAQDLPYYFTVGAAHTENEISVDHFGDHMKHSYTNELSLGYMLKDSLALEGSFVIPSVIQDDSRADIEQFRFSSLYFLSDDALKPYLTAGLGFEEMRTDGGSVSNALASVGAGVQYDSSERVFARAELRYDDMINEYPEHMNYVIEVGYRFGSAAAATASAAAAGSTVASNNMTDDSQLTAEEVNELPATAAGIPAKSAFEDSDNDGVADSVDQCADTGKVAMVGSNGCDLIKTVEALLRFPLNKAGMPGKATAYLDQIAAQAKEDKDLKIIVEGHADETGTDEFNQFISMERAKTIGNYLMARGVSKDAIELKAMSDSQPIADNTTEEGRQLNRRVELTVE